MQNLSQIQQDQLKQKGITPEKVQQQVEDFKKGFPFARLTAAAVEDNGLYSMAAPAVESYREVYRRATATDTVLKFVPASGAATRMFKSLYACYEEMKAGNAAPEIKKDVQEFFDNLPRYAFYRELFQAVGEVYGKEIDACIATHDYFPILDTLLEHPQGLKYGKKPKALLRFHAYKEGNRLSLEEHLVEGALYAQSNGVCNLHFTLSPEHRADFTAAVQEALPVYEKKYGVKYNISYSEQKSSTDTIAVKLDNEPFLDEEGRFVFRPGGHGALIENLNEQTEDIIFIKNIDNVTTDALRADTVAYKELLAGVLVDRRNKAYDYLKRLEEAGCEHCLAALVDSLNEFIEKELCVKLPAELKTKSFDEQKKFYRQLLDRPMRVCGMVRNTGEPGGGPFWVIPEGENTPSLQIVESSQVDVKNPEQEAIFRTARFFNPVDLVCSIYNYKHEKYDLRQYIDPQTAFISQKSVKGTDIKALELPGLWNGAMAKWLTLFVEVPASTFTPVKTINDLLRPAHQD